MFHHFRVTRLSLLFAILFLPIASASICLSATFQVGDGKQYSSIQSAINSANSGDTIRVYNGTYRESTRITKRDITLISHNQWGAILDGNNKSLKRTITVDASNTKIIGFRIQNYSTANSNNDGIVYLSGDANNSEVKYCIFEKNRTIGGNSGCLKTMYASGIVIRGNIFQNNVLAPGDGGSVDSVGASNSLIELNKFLDNSGAAYSLYHHVNGYSTTIRYNLFKKPNRFRQVKDGPLKVEQNIFENYLQLHDQTEDDFTERHLVRRNTFYAGSYGLMLVRQDGTTIDSNLFVRVGVGINDAWGSSPGTKILNNHYDPAGVSTWLKDFSSGNYSESGTTSGNPAYVSSTGYHNRLNHNQGADLKISSWPFTHQSGAPYATDYPYSGSQQSSISSATTNDAPPAPSGIRITN